MFKAKEYVKVKSLEEAWELNQKRSSMVMGGMVWLKMEKINKQKVIDLSGLGLDKIEENEEEFSIGCMVTLRQLETNKGLNDTFNNIFKECTKHIVGVQFRNVATVGGSIFGRFGFSDILTAMMPLNTYVELYKGGVLPLSEFAKMPYDNDILVRVIIKKDGRRANYVTQRRTKTDFPLIACCVACDDAKYYVSVGARPSRADLLVFDKECTTAQIVQDVKEKFTYGTNLRGSAEYRRDLAGIYTRRILEQFTEKQGDK